MKQNILTLNTTTIKPHISEVMSLITKLRAKLLISEHQGVTEHFDTERSQSWGDAGRGATIVYNIAGKRLHVIGKHGTIVQIMQEMRYVWGDDANKLLEGVAITELSISDGEYVEDEERRVILNRLNPAAWKDGELDDHVKNALMTVAEDFIELLQIDKKDIVDITLTGSNANYTWNEHSDFDVHIVVDMPEMLERYGEIFPTHADNSRKLWNLTRKVVIRGYEVEVYVEDADEVHDSTGIYSLLDDKWVVMPKEFDVMVDDERVEEKANKISKEITQLLSLGPTESAIQRVLDRIVKTRKAGLAAGGEMHEDNLVFKRLRNIGAIDKLGDELNRIRDSQMSVDDEE